nr:pre-mRNA-splicing factor CWC22 homolog [Tanacetum cinerariifolium]
MSRQRDRNGERSDDEDRYRRRDADRYRSERDGQDRRTSNRSDEEDKDGKRDRYRNIDRDRRSRDYSDDDGRRQDGKRDRRSNGDHKDGRKNVDVSKRRGDQNGDKENVDEGPRFQKLADMQEGMTNLGKSGGVYIPPFKLARMMSEVQDKSSLEYQRMTWDALKKSINGLVNKVIDELIALELLTTLLENPTDDSVEVAVGFITECGSILQDLSPKGLHETSEAVSLLSGLSRGRGMIFVYISPPPTPLRRDWLYCHFTEVTVSNTKIPSNKPTPMDVIV